MNEKEKKRQIVKISVFITSIFVIFLSVTYAFINQTLTGTRRQVITAGNLALEILEDENNLTITNAMPMYDEVGMIQDAFTFRIVNKIDAAADYKLKLIDITEASADQLDSSIIKYGLTKGQDEVIKDFISNIENDIIDSGTIRGRETLYYSLRLWIDSNVENNESLSSKTKSYRVDVEATQSLTELTPVGTATEVIANLYNEGKNTNIAKFVQPAIGNQNYDSTEYRYIGSNPNNYISFNDELWRIIGSFTVDDGKGNIEQRLKLIRAESIGKYSYDTSMDNSQGGYNYGYGAPTWNHAKLNTLLNDGAYWNRTTGTCYNGQYNATTSCDFSNIGLKDSAKNLIDSAILYLGNIPKEIPGLKTSNIYERERMNPNTTCTNSSICGDPVEKIPSWAGKVSIMYASDYGSAVDLNTCTSDLENYDSCSGDNWLATNSMGERVLTTREDSFLGSQINDSKNLFYVAASTNLDIRPTVYLKANVEIIKGMGLENDPYQISLNDAEATYYSYQVGDEITLKNGTIWNVIKTSPSNEKEVTLLSKYNYNSETGLQDQTCGMEINNNYYCHSVSYDEDATHEYNVSDNNNIGYIIDRKIQPTTASALGMHRTLAKLRLITYEEIADILGLSKTPTSIDLSSNSSPHKVWIMNTNFWTSTSYETSSEDFGNQGYAYAINVEENFFTASDTDNSFDFGIRPVITIDKSYIRSLNLKG